MICVGSKSGAPIWRAGVILEIAIAHKPTRGHLAQLVAHHRASDLAASHRCTATHHLPSRVDILMMGLGIMCEADAGCCRHIQ